MLERKHSDDEIRAMAVNMVNGVSKNFDLEVDWPSVAKALYDEGQEEVSQYLVAFADRLSPKDKFALAVHLLEFDKDAKKKLKNGRSRVKKPSKGKQH